MTRRAAIIVLDGLGIGPAHDVDAYGDAGSDTLGNVARRVGGLSLPYLETLGLGRCARHLPEWLPSAHPGPLMDYASRRAPERTALPGIGKSVA